MGKGLILSAIGFAALGALCRHVWWSMETRLHILAFWGAAIAFEVEVRRAFHVMPSVLGVVVDGAAATLAIIAVKWWIEGTPF